jgi:hypothetical protein
MASVPSTEQRRDSETAPPESSKSAGSAPETPPPDVLHDVLVNDRRRAIVRLLDGETSLRDLADEVARVETGEENPDRKTRQSVYITLHQCHLPKLDGFGVVGYDSDRKRVRPAAGLRAIRAYRDRIDERWARREADPSPLPYVGLGALGLGCLLVGAGGLAPGVSWAVACGVFLAVVGLAGLTVARRGGA